MDRWLRDLHDIEKLVMDDEPPEVILAIIRDRQNRVLEDLSEIKVDVKGIRLDLAAVTERVSMAERVQGFHTRRLDAIDGKDGKCENEKSIIDKMQDEIATQKVKMTFLVAAIAVIASALVNWLFGRLKMP